MLKHRLTPCAAPDEIRAAHHAHHARARPPGIIRTARHAWLLHGGVPAVRHSLAILRAIHPCAAPLRYSS
eukprot:394358-Prymnesium_polylepis.2